MVRHKAISSFSSRYTSGISKMHGTRRIQTCIVDIVFFFLAALSSPAAKQWEKTRSSLKIVSCTALPMFASRLSQSEDAYDVTGCVRGWITTMAPLAKGSDKQKTSCSKSHTWMVDSVQHCVSKHRLEVTGMWAAKNKLRCTIQVLDRLLCMTIVLQTRLSPTLQTTKFWHRQHILASHFLTCGTRNFLESSSPFDFSMIWTGQTKTEAEKKQTNEDPIFEVACELIDGPQPFGCFGICHS